MPLDALFLSAYLPELTEKLKNSRIDQIYHPLKDRVVLMLRHPYPGQEYLLSLSVHPQYARLHLTDGKTTNPLQPSAFCMLLRKYIAGGRILSFEQTPWERIITVWIEVYAPEKGLCRRKMVLEAMGRRSNLLLLDEDNQIMDALKRSSGEYPVMPGESYTPPPAVAPYEPPLSSEELQILLDRAPLERPLQELLRSEFMGISPFIAREWVSRSGYGLESRVADLKGGDGECFFQAFSGLIQDLQNPKPVFLRNNSGQIVDFSAFPPIQPGFTLCEATDLNELVASTLDRWDHDDRLRNEQAGIGRSIKERLTKLEKKKLKQRDELSQSEDADQLRIFGELLSINTSSIKKGQTQVELGNYYDPDNSIIAIPLRPDLSPTENMQLYFKKYQKAKKGRIAIAQQLQLTQEEIAYLEGVLYSLTDLLDPVELREIRTELAEAGYLGKQRHDSLKKAIPSMPRRFMSSEGVPIEVGRNNQQNDRLTLKISTPKDIWFHTQGIPGSHVLVRSDGQPFGDSTLLEAANLAAWFSKARPSSKIPVDYTARRNVKKPPGARPGFVLYQPFQTIIVTPDKELLQRLGVDIDG